MAHWPAPWEAALPNSNRPGKPPPSTGSPFLDAMQNPLLLVAHLAALPRHGKQQLWTLQEDQKLIFGGFFYNEAGLMMGSLPAVNPLSAAGLVLGDGGLADGFTWTE